MRIISGTRDTGQLFSSLGLIAGDPFIVAAGAVVLIDIDTPALGATTINGTVKPSTLTSTKTLTTTGITINNGGALEYGMAGAPCNGPSIVLNGAYSPLVNTTIAGFTTPTTSDASNRGIMVMPGGRCDLHGTSPATIYTTINAAAAAAQPNLTLATSPGWASSDAVVLGPTDFPDYQNAEQFTLNGATSGTAAVLSGNISVARYGVLQYPTDTGLSTTSSTFSTKKASANVPTVLDERARVANLTRGLSISAPNDSDWTNKGHGVVIMAMATNGTNQAILRIEGTQIRRGGQRGAIGRYPIHWHMMSYHGTTGVFTANATLNYCKKSVVWESENRAYTIHGTCGVELSDNIAYLAKGHNFFLEDGSEMSNTITGNMSFKPTSPSAATALPAISSISGTGSLVTIIFASAHGMYTGQTLEVYNSSNSGYSAYRMPCTVVNSTTVTYAQTGTGAQSGATAYKNFDQIKGHDSTVAGFWITNMYNTITGNYASGSTTGHGMWCSLANQCFGLSAVCTTIIPDAIDPISTSSFADFTGHSNFGFGLHFADAVSDEAGSVGLARKYPQSVGVTFTSSDHKLWKNASGGYFNASNVPIYQRWTVADNHKTVWAGTTNNGGTSFDHLGIGTSLNNANTVPLHNREEDAGQFPQSAFVSYHGTIIFTNCSWFNFAYQDITYWFYTNRGSGGGVMQGGVDFYDIAGIDTTVGLSTGFKYSSAHPGAVIWPTHLSYWPEDHSGVNNNQRFAPACVWWDTDGKYGTAGKYIMPFSYGLGTVDDYFLNSATNVVNGPTTGTVVCQTTDTKFQAIGGNDNGGWYQAWTGTPVNGNQGTGSVGDQNPIRITRQVLATGVTIGTPFTVKRGDTGYTLSTFRQCPMQNGGRFKLEFAESTVVTISNASPAVITHPLSASHGLVAGATVTFSNSGGGLPSGISAGTTYFVLASGLTNSTFQVSLTAGGAAINTTTSGSGTHSYTYALDPPTSIIFFDIFTPQAALGDFMLLSIPWANGAAAPRVAFGSQFSNEQVADSGRYYISNGTAGRFTFPSAANVTANKAIICTTSVGSIASVLADTTGLSYFRDSTNNCVWVRYTNRNTVGGVLTSNVTQFGIDVKTVVVKV